MTEVELLMDTVQFYADDPNRRSVIIEDNGDHLCMYSHNGKHCAIGRFLLDHPVSIEGQTAASLPEKLFPREIYRMGLNFIEALQTLHDTSIYWDNNGLSDSGKVEVETMADKYQLSLPPAFIKKYLTIK